MTDDTKTKAAAGLVVLAMFMWAVDGRQTSTPVPPVPPDSAPLTLRGLFVGQTAADDAAIVAALSSEIADEILWDAQQAKPMYSTGMQMDELRTRARMFRCRGERIGDRQPKVRDAIHAYLEDAVGVSGGPLTPEQRAKWAAAYRVIGKAAADATR